MAVRHHKIGFISLIPGLLRSSFEPSVGAAGWRGSRRTARRTRSARRRSNVAAGRTTSCADGNLEDDSRLARPENSQRLCHGTLQKTKAIKHLLLMMMITQLRQQGKCDDSLITTQLLLYLIQIGYDRKPFPNRRLKSIGHHISLIVITIGYANCDG